MTSQSDPNKPTADDASDAPSRASAEEVLRPFQSASVRFLQASAARDAAPQPCAQARLDVHGEGRRGESTRQLFKQHQDAFQAYLADLQRAWSGTEALDPQAMSAIGATILFTIHAVSQGS